MRILVSIDDTDTIKAEGAEVRGTGQLASLIRQAIEDWGWGYCAPVTLHQLFIHPDIPYTSHNSAMCFQAEIDAKYLDDIITFASDFLIMSWRRSWESTSRNMAAPVRGLSEP